MLLKWRYNSGDDRQYREIGPILKVMNKLEVR